MRVYRFIQKTKSTAIVIGAAFALVFNSSSAEAIADIPFTSQAPDANWKNPLYQNGCEEASVIMAMRWVKDASLSKKEVIAEMKKLSEYETKRYGTHIDLSVRDIAKLVRDFYGYKKVETKFSIRLKDIIDEIASGAFVVVPVDGRLLKNPFYTQPGPERHMLPIIGYDHKKKEFITNDPGTRRGSGYRYGATRLYNAIGDYPTGDHVSVKKRAKAMIVVRK